MEVTEAIKKEIEKQMTGEAAAIIKTRLAEAERLEEQNKTLVKDLAESRTEVRAWQAKDRDLTRRENDVGERGTTVIALEKRLRIEEDSLHDQRHDIKLAHLEMHLVQRHSDDMRGIIRDICGGPVMTRTMKRTLEEDRTTSEPQYDEFGNRKQHDDKVTSETLKTEETEEETETGNQE